MSIKIKIILIVLPLLIATLLVTWRSSSLLAESGITRLTNDLLNFKVKVLNENISSQWDRLVESNLSKIPEFVDLTKNGIQPYAKRLLNPNRQSELIIAFNNKGEIVMKTSSVLIVDKEQEEVNNLIKSKETKLVELPLGGIERVAVGFYFAPFDWYFLVSEEKAVFYQDVTQITNQSMVILGLSILVSIVLLWFFVSYLTRPLTKVVSTMKDIIVYNDLSERVLVEYNDETGELAHTFNLMVAELEKAYNQIKNYAFKAGIAQKKEKRIRHIFQKYVPNDVINQFFANPDSMLVGENRVLSILFSDIRSFTTISEGMMPDELVNSLNRYFSIMVDIIMGRNGIVDKYIGDAIMAFFGAPVKHEDDALQSVYAGMEMMEALDSFNKHQTDHGLPEFHTGIGINYGIVTVGNIGSEKKMDYTVIGDMVNLASRLEGLTKQYHQGLIISESVRKKVVDTIPCRMVDKVAVKGKTKGVNIYTARKTLTETEKKGWYYHGEAMRTYYDQDFIGAIKLFVEVQKYLPNDYLAQLFIERCKEYSINPPNNWDGIEVLKSK